MILRLLLSLALITQGMGGKAGIGGKAGFGGGVSGGGGTAPTIVGASPCAGFVFSTPMTCSLGTLSVNDIVVFESTSLSNGATLTPSFTGGCAASGGFTTDAGPTGHPNVASTTITGHAKITTGASCTLSVAYTGTGDGIISALAVRSSSGLDVASAINNQSGTGAGANIITSGSAVSLTANDRCVAMTVDTNADGGTLTAGTTLAWTLDAHDTTFPNGIEDFAQNGGTLQATFGISNTAYSQTAVSCFKP